MRESVAVGVTLLTTGLYSIVMTTWIVASIAASWAVGDPFGMLLAWIWIPLSTVVHELTHRTVFRRHGVDARIVLSWKNIFGGSTSVPTYTPREIALKGAVAGPLSTMAFGLAALALSPVFKPLSVAALLLSFSVIGAGVPFSLDGRYMTRGWKIFFISVGAAMLAATLITIAYLVKYG